MIQSATSIDEVQEAVSSISDLKIRSGGSKTAMSRHANLCVAKMAGVLQYEPSEYTFTALAGTKLSDVREMLAENGQFMPFDPPMVDAGGTLGGTVAAGISGAGRFRFGGVRDFILGVRLVTHDGRIVFGGGKVVKNAAGFDIPKLLVGSAGRLGVMTELTFKVFPQPACWSTLLLKYDSFEDAAGIMLRIAGLPLDLTCLDLDPAQNMVAIRLGGIEKSVSDRINRVRSQADSHGSCCKVESLSGNEDLLYWSGTNEFSWLDDTHRLVKIPLSPSQVVDAEDLLNRFGDSIPRRYSVGGNVLWIGWPTGLPHANLDGFCSHLSGTPLAVTGNWPDQPKGLPAGEFETRIAAAFGAAK